MLVFNTLPGVMETATLTTLASLQLLLWSQKAPSKCIVERGLLIKILTSLLKFNLAILSHINEGLLGGNIPVCGLDPVHEHSSLPS